MASGQGSTSLTVTVGSTVGNVSVRAASATCGNSNATNLLVTPFANPPAQPDGIQGEATPCVNADVTYTITNPVAGLTYNWTLPTGWSVVSGAGTESVVVKVGSNSGNIRVTASNDCGTSSSIARVVTPTTGNATMSAIAGAANVCPDATGLIYSVTPSAGISGYQWTVPAGWAIESGQGTAQITVTAPASGSGNLVVNAVNECNVPVSRSIVVAVTSGAPLAIQDIVGEANVCATQEYTYSVPVVTGATLYTWTVPVGATVISGAGTSAITVRMGMSAGQVAVFASNNCSTSPTKQFAVNTPGTEPEAISGITGAAAVCSSDPSRTYTIGNVAGATGYTWSVPSGWTILAGQGTLSLTVKPGLLGGNLKVDASNACGTTSSTMAVTVTQPIAGLSDISGTQVPCENQSGLTYSITPVAGANYTWTVPGGWTITSGQNTASIQVQAGSAAGQITVKATNLCGDSPMSTLDVSTMQQKPDAPTALSGEATPCIGAPGITYAIQAPVTGLTYNWTLPTGWTLVSGQGTSTISVNIGATAGNISVTASNGCGTSDAFAFAVAPTVGTPAITGDMEGTSTLCGGATPLVYKVTGTAGATYTWTVPTGWTILTGQNTPQIEVTAGTTGGTVSVTGNNGCGTITRTMSVTVQTPITGTLSAITGKATPCQAEENLVYSVNTLANATTYTWQVPTGWTIVSGQNTNTITVKAGTGAGTIRVTASNTCGDSQPAELQVAPTAAPDAPLAIAGGVQPCPNALQVQYGVASAIPGVTYNWSVPAGWTLVSGQGGATILVNVGTTDGTISVTASNNCGTSAVTSRFITLGAPAPVITTEIQGNAAVCANTAATTYEIAPVTGATAYTWSVPAGWTISSGQGGTTITVQVGTASGEVKVVASNGCGTGTKIMNVTVTPDVLAAPVAINGNLTVCPATSNLIYSVQAVSGATSYNWAVPTGWTIISGQGTASIRVQSGTTDGQITVSAVGTCATSATTSLSVQVTGPAPALGNIAGTATVCEDAVVMYEVAPVTGVTTYQWSLPAGWSFISGQGTNSISVRTGTTGGTVSVSSANACFTNPTPKTYAVVVSGSRPAKPGTITPSVAIPCSNQPGLVYTVAAVPGATGYVWSVPAGWTITAGGTTNTITVLSGTGTGNITVKATNTCGESAVESMSVTATPALGTVGDIKNETDVCAGYQFSIDPVTGADPNGYVWSAPAGWTIITGQGTTRVTMKADKPITNSEIISVYASNGACTTVAKTFEVLPGQVGVEDDMNVPNAFSPNNDGKNDVWVVRGLLNYADNELVVVNRWGSEVFRQKGYANNWDGKGLAEGTYYYILKVRLCNNREVTYKGFVMLTR
ncbi:MAG: gliding motility-associated C-terminal domain-containing protein [Rufibacter sp.]